MVALFAKVETKTVGKTLVDVEAEALVDTLSETLSEVVGKIIADTLTCVKVEAPVKTGNNTVAGVEAYTTVNIVNELKGQALVYTQAYAFPEGMPRVLPTHRLFYYR